MATASLDKEFSSPIRRGERLAREWFRGEWLRGEWLAGERIGARDDAMSTPMASRQGRWPPAASTTQRAILA
jgi:hypothetical protein